jgi:hypothetical protein
MVTRLLLLPRSRVRGAEPPPLTGFIDAMLNVAQTLQKDLEVLLH